MSARRLRHRLERLEHLASPPEALVRILDLAADPESQVPELARAVKGDPVLAVRLLRLSNSAYFGYRREIETVEHALVVLGSRTVRNLVTAVALAPVFSGGGDGLDRPTLWLHSCAVAEAARLVAERRGRDGSVPYLAGLVHDVGQVALADAVPGLYAEVLEREAETACGLLEAERKELGADHAWAGGLLLGRWQLPERLVSAVRLHHEGGAAEDELVPTLVLAGALAARAGFGGPARRPPETAVAGAVLARLGLSDEDLEDLDAAFQERRDAVEALFASSRAGAS